MPRPAPTPRESVTSCVTLLRWSAAVGLGALGAPDSSVASEEMRAVLREALPKYDPNAKAAAQPGSAKATRDSKSRGKPGLSDKTASAGSPTNQAPVVLPRMIVRPTDSLPAPPMAVPQLRVTRPAKDLPAGEFETDAARSERLVKKHLTDFDRLFLNRFTLPLFGTTKEQRADGAEAVEHAAQGLNEAAELLAERPAGAPETPEERKLREALRDAYVTRPK